MVASLHVSISENILNNVTLTESNLNGKKVVTFIEAYIKARNISRAFDQVTNSEARNGTTPQMLLVSDNNFLCMVCFPI
jgi:hypothetical protein